MKTSSAKLAGFSNLSHAGKSSAIIILYFFDLKFLIQPSLYVCDRRWNLSLGPFREEIIRILLILEILTKKKVMGKKMVERVDISLIPKV